MCSDCPTDRDKRFKFAIIQSQAREQQNLVTVPSIQLVILVICSMFFMDHCHFNDLAID